MGEGKNGVENFRGQGRNRLYWFTYSRHKTKFHVTQNTPKEHSSLESFSKMPCKSKLASATAAHHNPHRLYTSYTFARHVSILTHSKVINKRIADYFNRFLQPPLTKKKKKSQTCSSFKQKDFHRDDFFFLNKQIKIFGGGNRQKKRGKKKVPCQGPSIKSAFDRMRIFELHKHKTFPKSNEGSVACQRRREPQFVSIRSLSLFIKPSAIFFFPSPCSFVPAKIINASHTTKHL